MRIAIVEDQGLFADFLAKICLQELNADVVINTRDGGTAGAAVIALNPDLVILDLGLPGADGFTIAKQIRAHVPRTRDLSRQTAGGQRTLAERRGG